MLRPGYETPVAGSSRWTVAALWLLTLYSVVHFSYTAGWFAWNTLGGDFISAFPGPLTLRLSRLLPDMAGAWVEPAMVKYTLGPEAWNYGPVLHVVTLPFALASSQLQAMRLVLLSDYALVAVSFSLWMRLLFPGRAPWPVWLVILCIWLNHFPLLEALTGREIEIFELFLLTVAVWALRARREGLAGVAVGAAAMTKFLPIVFVPYLFLKGYRKAGWIAVFTVIACALAAQLTAGWQRSVTVALANSESNAAVFPTAYANQALTNVLYKTFTAFNINDPRPPTLYPYQLRRVGTALSALLFAATAGFLIRWRRLHLLEIEFALLMIVMCLLPSHANTYYFVFVLPALSIGVAAWYQRPASGAALKIALVAAVAMTGFLVPMKVFEVVTHVPGVLVARVLQGWSLPAYGAILAVAVLAEWHRLSRKPQPILPAA